METDILENQVKFDIGARGEADRAGQSIMAKARKNETILYIGKMEKDIYHNTVGISSTGLRQYYQDPYAYYFDKVNPPPTRQKKHFRFGQMIHEIMLESKNYLSDEDFVCEILSDNPKLKNPRLTKKYQDWKSSMEETSYILTPEEHLMVSHWESVCKKADLLKPLFERTPDNVFENAIFLTCPNTNLILKFCPDIFILSKKLMADLKTSTASGIQQWSLTVESYRYDIQAAFYLYCANLLNQGDFSQFPFICLEKERPYRVFLKSIHPSQIEIGRKIVIDTLKQMRASYARGEWGLPFNNKIEESNPSYFYREKYSL